MKFVLVIALGLTLSLGAMAQDFAPKYALRANVAELVQGATLDFEASVGFSRHWSADADVRYNPYFDALRQRSAGMALDMLRRRLQGRPVVAEEG